MIIGRSGKKDATITTNFLARTSGLDATHRNAYRRFINGLVADGLCTDTTWGKFDLLYILATQDATTALLNLPSATYNATAGNSPTFTADQGYTFALTKYLTTAFNPSTASSPNFVRNAASMGVYDRTAAAAQTGGLAGGYDGAIDNELTPRYTGDLSYWSLNDPGANSFSSTTTQGSLFTNRSASGSKQFYRNGSSFATDTEASSGLINVDLYIGSINVSGVAHSRADQIAAMWAGGNFSGAEMTAFQARLNTLATTLGWNTY